MLLLLNIFAPTTSDVRVVKYVVPIVSGVRGRVLEVPVENNRPVKKGDVLFKIDPSPYEADVTRSRPTCSRNWRRSRRSRPSSTK
jgi:multidrug resistance efflux pump